MPLYEYKCLECGVVFETLQKFSDEPLKTHKTCGGEVERLISRSAFHFKGTGWYATDYAKKSNGKSAPAKDAKNGGATAKPESATASKSSDAAKPDSATKA